MKLFIVLMLLSFGAFAQDVQFEFKQEVVYLQAWKDNCEVRPAKQVEHKTYWGNWEAPNAFDEYISSVNECRSSVADHIIR